MRRLLLLAVLLVLLVPAPARAAEPGGTVTVVGVAGLRWDDVSASATPALWRLSARSAVGALSVKALPAVSCPADGWLTLGAGTRAEAYGTPRGPCGSDLPDDLAVQRRRNAGTRDAARLGLLAEALQRAGTAVQAQGPGAQLAVAGVASAPGPARVRLLDAGALPQDGARARALAEVDAAVEGAVQAAGRDGTVLVVGVAESPGEDEARLHVALAAGPAFPPGALQSPSTGRRPYVQLLDVAPTVLRLLDVPVPPEADGQPWSSAGAAPTPARLADLDRHAAAQKRVTVPFFVVLIGAQVALLGLLRRRPGPARLVGLAGVAALPASYLADLVPWWRAGAPLAVLLAVVAAVAVAAALAVRRQPRALGLVAGAGALVVTADLVTGARLQMSSVAGYSPLVAGRFAGIGNVAFGVYAALALLAVADLLRGASRRTAGLAVAAAGLLVVAADGAPPWGSDVGGVLALVPAFVVLALLLTGTRVSLVRLAAACLAGALVVTGFALADAARPPERRTHLGRFVQQVRDGTAGEVLHRKAAAVLGLLFHSPVTALLPLVVVAAVLLVLRPPPTLRAALARHPAHRHGLAALAVAAAVGFAVNDSGAAVVALALLVAVPASVAVLCGEPEQRPGAAG